MNTRLSDSVIVSKKSVQQKGGVVVLPLREYRKLLEKSAPAYRTGRPTYYLSGKDAEKLDKLVKGGLKEYREGKTTRIMSLSDLD